MTGLLPVLAKPVLAGRFRHPKGRKTEVFVCLIIFFDSGQRPAAGFSMFPMCVFSRCFGCVCPEYPTNSTLNGESAYSVEYGECLGIPDNNTFRLPLILIKTTWMFNPDDAEGRVVFSRACGAVANQPTPRGEEFWHPATRVPRGCTILRCQAFLMVFFI